jgi:hypothetical protein
LGAVGLRLDENEFAEIETTTAWRTV